MVECRASFAHARGEALLDISKMRQVIAIYETGSLAKAADRLGLAQASLSKSLARLEDELGVRIFERSSTGSRPTVAGTLIVERAQQVIEAAESLQRDVSLLAGGEPKELRIGAAIALSSKFLPDLALRVAEKYPKVRMRLEIASARELVDRLSSRTFDIIFAGLPPQVDQDGFEVVAMLSAPTIVVASSYVSGCWGAEFEARRPARTSLLWAVS